MLSLLKSERRQKSHEIISDKYSYHINAGMFFGDSENVDVAPVVLEGSKTVFMPPNGCGRKPCFLQKRSSHHEESHPTDVLRVTSTDADLGREGRCYKSTSRFKSGNAESILVEVD